MESESLEDGVTEVRADRSQMENQFLRKNSGGKSKAKVFPWVVCVSASLALVLASTAFLQLQIISLKTELVQLRTNLSNALLVSGFRRSSRGVENFSVSRPEFQRMQAVHLKGLIPFQHIQHEGRIGPWKTSRNVENLIKLEKSFTEVEIIHGGMYLIYVQIYYLTSEKVNSFQLSAKNATKERLLSVCSAQAAAVVGEVSCYTAVVEDLVPGERLYLTQVEQNRLIHFGDRCSYFGVVLLQKSSAYK